MEAFSVLLTLCAGNSPVTGEFPSQRPVTRSFDIFFDLRLNKRLSKQSRRGDLRRHRVHYDVIVWSDDRDKPRKYESSGHNKLTSCDDLAKKSQRKNNHKEWWFAPQ